ncbi:MAG: peptidase [Eggerthellaceae bacterium]|nr:peptidase [Eggerthellaceae bacterium]
MPAIITHDTFGQDVYNALYTFIGGSKSDAEAFMLGNQGPDPLFFLVLSPRYAKYSKLGQMMHRTNPAELLVCFKDAELTVAPAKRQIARAYVLGFLCHYLLDSSLHPFIYAQEYALCGAGVEGLDASAEHEVHAVIESELDELMLTTKRFETLDTFNPAHKILRASEDVLDIISSLYCYVAIELFEVIIPPDTFKRAVRDYRRYLELLYSPKGIKRDLLGRAETLIRPHSYLKAMSYRNIELTHSEFENSDHLPWTDPDTGCVSTASFKDLYDEAFAKAVSYLFVMDSDTFDLNAAHALTGDVNFSGITCKNTGAPTP